jgi:hypothetical protein
MRELNLIWAYWNVVLRILIWIGVLVRMDMGALLVDSDDDWGLLRVGTKEGGHVAHDVV